MHPMSFSDRIFIHVGQMHQGREILTGELVPDLSYRGVGSSNIKTVHSTL